MEKELYTVSELATRFVIHPNTIRNWIAAGQLKARKVGLGHSSRFYITKEEVDRVFKDHSQAA